MGRTGCVRGGAGEAVEVGPGGGNRGRAVGGEGRGTERETAVDAGTLQNSTSTVISFCV